MRVYELAQIYSVTSKAIIDALASSHFPVKSHMSVLGDEAITFLEINLIKKTPQKISEDSASQVPNQASKQVAEPANESPTIMQKETTISKNSRRTSPTRTATPTSFVVANPKKQTVEPVMQPVVIEPMTVGVAAQRMGQPVNEVILTLLKWGVVATKNITLSRDIVKRLIEHYGLESQVALQEIKQGIMPRTTAAGTVLNERIPVVAVLGHVDHGKTSLLDFIRKTRVASREKGGITQHLGAYEASTPQGSIVFLDTPGHEAFSKIRQRGVKVADIVVLVVAADDGIMPQTIEAIKHIKAMGSPVIVAINKVDKVEKERIEVVKRQLAQYDMLPEEWGGQTVVVPISAKTGFGVDQLLEMIVLQGQMMELRADTQGMARGYVLEAQLEKGRGAVATVIAQHGKIAVGDYFLCGSTAGRVTSLVDSLGRRVEFILPPLPVAVAGFESLPDVGDLFQVVPKQEYLVSRSHQDARKEMSTKETAAEGAIQILLKADTHSSQEALIESIERISRKSPVTFHIVSTHVGDISESDVEFAFNTGAQIIGFHVKVQPNAAELARKRGVSIQLYDIIYKLLEALQAHGETFRKVEMVKVKTGEAIVRKVFDIKNLGVIAGVYIQDGLFSRDGYVVIWRGKHKIGEGKIMSLQRDKKTVKEVRAGFEGGFMVEGITDWAVDDRVECFVEKPKQ
jgi:translation initiation factor IF-2